MALIKLGLEEKPGIEIAIDKYEVQDLLGVRQHILVDSTYNPSNTAHIKTELLRSKNPDVIKLKDKILRNQNPKALALAELLVKDQNITIEKLVKDLSNGVYLGEVNSSEHNLESSKPPIEDSVLETAVTFENALEDSDTWGVVFGNYVDNSDTSDNLFIQEESRDQDSIKDILYQGLPETSNITKQDTLSMDNFEDTLKQEPNVEVIGKTNINSEEIQRSGLIEEIENIVSKYSLRSEDIKQIFEEVLRDSPKESSSVENLDEVLKQQFSDHKYELADLLSSFQDGTKVTMQELIESGNKEISDLIENSLESLKESLSFKQDFKNLVIEPQTPQLSGDELKNILNDFSKEILKNLNKEKSFEVDSFLKISKPVSKYERALIEGYEKGKDQINFLRSDRVKEKFLKELVEVNGVRLFPGAEKIIESATLGFFEFISVHYPFIFLEYKTHILKKLIK